MAGVNGRIDIEIVRKIEIKDVKPKKFRSKQLFTTKFSLLALGLNPKDKIILMDAAPGSHSWRAAQKVSKLPENADFQNRLSLSCNGYMNGGWLQKMCHTLPTRILKPLLGGAIAAEKSWFMWSHVHLNLNESLQPDCSACKIFFCGLAATVPLRNIRPVLSTAFQVFEATIKELNLKNTQIKLFWRNENPWHTRLKFQSVAACNEIWL